ncbi:MAG: hypothetical protein Pg6A_19390 [Termitinemataceae bacterium]|nr:MAG: hypothetical protein Pg6A_19390 [Termitinemataceae bacterium]
MTYIVNPLKSGKKCSSHFRAALVAGGLAVLTIYPGACKQQINVETPAPTPTRQVVWTSADGMRHTNIPDSKERWFDGEVLEYNIATKGEGIDIVFVGDGFNKKEMEVNGVFETTAKDLAELFLKMPIVRDYREYFNIYILMRVFPKSGIDNMFSGGYRGLGSRLNEFDKLITAMPQVGAGKEDKLTFVCIGNGWAGGYMVKEKYPCISLQYTNLEKNTPYLVAHELFGHAFTMLGDLYITTDDLNTREDIKKYWTPSIDPVKEAPKWEWGCNYFVATWSDEAWQKFVNAPGNSKYAGNESKYTQFLKGRYIWQNRYAKNFMTANSSLQSDTFDRFLAYRRIKTLAGEEYSVPDFLAVDQQYINLTDWYEYLGVANWKYTYPPPIYGEPSPYSDWDDDI